jgi:membrane-associated phospholipid phosphatase
MVDGLWPFSPNLGSLPLVLFLLVIALHLWLVWVAPFPGDRWALRQAWTPHPTWVRDYADFFQHLATPLVAIALVAVALTLILRHGSLAEAAGLVVTCLAVPLNAILKLVLGASPLWRTAHSGHSYPSGHTTFVVAVIGYVGVIAWRHDRRWLAALAALLIAAVGPARVVTGIHLVSDVVGAYLLGAAMLLLALRVAGGAGGATGAGARAVWSAVPRRSRT